jgi:4-amino-4-deoxy-L-arabinose transferase-like glycosyltransferase
MTCGGRGQGTHSMRRNLLHKLKSPLLIVVVALLLRLGLLAYGQTYRISTANDHWRFGAEIGRIARSISQGHGFSSPYWAPTGPTAQQPPVYPYLLAGSFKFFGVFTPGAAFAMLSLNSLFSALTCVFLLLIGRRAFGETVGTLAAWAWVFWPSAALIPITRLWHESLAALLLAVLFWMTLRLEESRSIHNWLIFGVLWGVAALTNPVVLSAMPFLLGWVCYRRRKRRFRWARPLALTLAATAIVMLPWLVRNYVVFHKPVFVSDDLAMNLHLGNHSGATGAHTEGVQPAENVGEWKQYQRLGELAYMAAKRRQALSFIASHPGGYAWLCLQRFGELWIWTGTFRPFGSVFPALIWQAFYLALPLLALAGLALAFRDRVAAAWPVAFTVFTFLGTYVVIEYSSPRYRHPVEPELVLLGAFAVTVLWRRVRGRISSPVAHAEQRAI